MGLFNRNLSRTLVGATIGIAAGVATTTAIAENAGITLTPMVGHIDFDSSRDLDEEVLPAFGLGYRFDNPWQLELVYAKTETESDLAPGVDIDYETLHLDALYHFGEDKAIVPYLALGFGHVEFDVDLVGREKESNHNLGLGLKVALNDSLSLRPDVRAYRDFEHENIDMVYSLGLQWSLGGNRSSSEEPQLVADVRTPGDVDNDGVNDDVDQCPATPAGVQVDATGCALDDDGDGVPNHQDACPGSEAGAKVDARGCYVMLNEQVEITLEVNFANNSSVVQPQYDAEVAKVAEFMRSYPETNVTVEGHTDSNGSAGYNKTLSEKRAKSIADKLILDHKVSADRVSAVGYGEDRPIADNATAEGRSENRRVVAVISTTVEKRAE